MGVVGSGGVCRVSIGFSIYFCVFGLDGVVAVSSSLFGMTRLIFAKLNSRKPKF